MKVAVLGAGSVGSKLGSQLKNSGFHVKYGARDPTSDKVKAVLTAQPGTTASSVKEAVSWADAIILAVPGQHSDEGITQQLVEQLLPEAKGKVVIDATNPLSPFPKLEVRWAAGTSGGEVLAAAMPDSFVFKAFNTIGAEHMDATDGSRVTGEQLTMLYCGPIEKKDVAEMVVAGTGFKPVYVGPIRYARNLEAMAELWIHLGVPPVHQGGGLPSIGRNFHFQFISNADKK